MTSLKVVVNTNQKTGNIKTGSFDGKHLRSSSKIYSNYIIIANKESNLIVAKYLKSWLTRGRSIFYWYGGRAVEQ
jgi:hypothetical protein